MPRRLSPEKQLELERLARILGAFAAWADPLVGISPDVEPIRETVARAHDARNLPGLRMMLDDLIEMTQGATTAQRRELDGQLRERAGVSLSSLLERQFARVERFRRRGSLTSEEQYYLVRQHVELIADDPEHVSVVPELYALLESYEVSAVERSRRRDRRQDI